METNALSKIDLQEKEPPSSDEVIPVLSEDEPSPASLRLDDDGLNAAVPHFPAVTAPPVLHAVTCSPQDSLEQFRAELNDHPIWRCRLLRSCHLGHYFLADFQYIFSQYYLYSRSFTRYLGALLARCESDLHRARLTQNLWEEGGMQKPEERHAQLFRDFLEGSLGVTLSSIKAEPFSDRFVDRYLTYCLEAHPASASAFLALGTEALVPRLYAVFVEGLRRAGLADSDLRFFLIHMECDDAHAATLGEMTAAYQAEPHWESLVRQGMHAALDERLRFFDHLYDGLRNHRLSQTMARVQAKQALASPQPKHDEVLFPKAGRGVALYANRIDRLNVDFAATRVPFRSEVLDTRLVHIPAGRCNERHRHAHETVFYIVSGTGRLRVNESLFPVGPGDIAFVPRWALHQVENEGVDEMVILAVTDFGFTGKAFIGDYERTARHRQDSK